MAENYRYIGHIGLVFLPIKIDTKIICTPETHLNKLFEPNKLVTAIADPDAKVIWHDTLFMQYEQLRLNDNFRQYLETSIISKKVFQTSVQQKIPLPK